jgi:hypothetical protein
VTGHDLHPCLGSSQHSVQRFTNVSMHHESGYTGREALGVKFRLIAVFALIVSMFATTLSASAQDTPPYDPHTYEFGTDEFQAVWDRTDLPVQEGATERTWLWGPGANTPLINEIYLDSPTDERQVQYTDKSRMEMPWNGAADETSPWFITQGLLAREMMTGQLQIGDADFLEFFPSQIQVAGDPGSPGPTYLTMGSTMDNDPRSEGNIIVDVITADGFIFQNQALGPAYNVTDQYYIEETGFYIADVFWSFMISSGPVYEDGILQTGQIFESPFYAVGLPITPAYWAWVEVNEVPQNVLVQCFERRCLTYTPNNPSAWQVESGNVGQHYFEWRYNQIGAIDPPAPDPAEASSFSVSPADSTNAVGDTHEITVSVLDQYGEAFEGAGVSASVTETTTPGNAHLGVTLDPEDAASGADGTVTLSYTGVAAGTDTITVDVDGIEASATVSKTWADYTLVLDPEESTNPLGGTHEIEITVIDSDDAQVDIAAGSDVSADITRVFDDAADDDAATTIGVYSVEVDDGVATLSYAGADTPAQDTIEITVTVGDVSVSGTATKTWAGPELVLDPEDAENLVGTQASLTASIEQVDGTQVDFDDDEEFDVTVTREFADDSTVEFSTDDGDSISVEVDDGVATITYDGANEPATDTIEVSVTVDDVEYTATTTKTWGLAVVSVTPEESTNPYFGEDVVFVEFLHALAIADDLEIDLDGQALLQVIDAQELAEGDEVNWEQAFDDAGLTGDDLTAMVAAIDDVNVDHHTVTVSVDAPGDASGTVSVVIEHIDADDDENTTTVFNDDFTLEDGSLSEEITYQSAGIGTDSVTVTVNGTDFDFEDVKTWENGLVDSDGALTLNPLDPDPNPIGSDHSVTGTMQDDGVGLGPGIIIFDFSDDDDENGESVHQPADTAIVTDENGSAMLTYTGDGQIDEYNGGSDAITAYGYYLNDDGFIALIIGEDVATKQWYVPAAELELSVVSNQYNHPGNEPWDAYDFQAELKDASGNTVINPYGQLDLTFTLDSGGSFLDETGNPVNSITVTSVDGFANVTLASGRVSNTRPTDVNVTVDADGVDPDSEQVQFAGVFLELDVDDIDGALAGSPDGHDVIASVTNFSEAAGGIDYEAVLFQITLTGPVDCTGNDWEAWFEITAVDGDGDTEGINDTFECVDGSFVGYWGPPTGFPLDAEYDTPTEFEVEVKLDAPHGTFELTLDLIDKNDDDNFIVTVNDTFNIISQV